MNCALLILLLITPTLCVSRPISTRTQYSSCSSDLHSSNSFEVFFNQCLRDTSQEFILGSIAEQTLEWFSGQIYLQYLLVFLYAIPCLSFWVPKPDAEAVAVANHRRLQTLMLMFRISLAISLTPWLQTLFQQGYPCLCELEQVKVVIGDYQRPFARPWAMPCGEVVSVTLMALHFAQYVYFPGGVAVAIPVLIIFCMSVLTIGMASLGQMLGGLLLGILLHMYEVFTPFFLRPLDTAVSFTGGVLSFILVYNYNKGDSVEESLNFSFAATWLTGIVWMMFVISAYFLFYGITMTMHLWKSSIHFMATEEFLYFSHNEGAEAETLRGGPAVIPQRKGEMWAFSALVVMLFIVETGILIYAPYISWTLFEM